MESLYVTDYERCPELVDSQSRIINGVDPDDADLLFLSETPGAREDGGGEPFVGRSGSMLDNALHRTSLARTDVRIANCVWCRPPDNHDPTSNELSNCRGYPARELGLADPELVVTLGRVPSRHLLDRSVAITSESGSVVSARVRDASYRVLLSVHPATTLYNRSRREGLLKTIAHAADLSGLADPADGQTSLGNF